MMLPLRVACSPGPSASITSAPASSAWMLLTSVCVSSAGSMRSWARWQSSPGTGTRQKNRSCLPPTWTKEELGKRNSIERFFGRVFLFFHLQRPPLCGWAAIARQVALTYAATIIVALAAQQAGRSDLIRSLKRVLAHLGRAYELGNAFLLV